METEVSITRLQELIVSLDDDAPRVIDTILASIADKIFHLREVESIFGRYLLARGIIRECDSLGILGVKDLCAAFLHSTDQEELNDLINEIGFQFGIAYTEIVGFISANVFQECLRPLHSPVRSALTG